MLVNFEDHIQIIMLPRTGVQNNVRNALNRLIKLNKTFEKMGFATDAYLGFLTVSPANLGTGMQFSGSMIFSNKGKSEEDTALVEQTIMDRLAQGKSMLVEFS